ncbi:hypothetical protein HanPI659440_Chr04g0158801 [Helianthus annuus]|nr:hypothetical protein HanPI659440_Chr04g0158801 [Helianthus annuus]
MFKPQSEEPFPPKKRGWFSRGADGRRKRLRKLQQQCALAAANRETNAHTQDMLNRSLANFHILATTAADPNLEQLIAPQPLPLFPTQPMDLEPNPVDQIPMHDFDPAEIPRVPAPHLPDYDIWFDDHRDYEQCYPIPNEPMPNLAAYPNLDPLEPYYDNDQFIKEILENTYPPEEPMPQFPNPIPAPAPPMSTENVQELRTFGEEILEGSERMRQIGERLV